jgi:hypothetical protein
MITLFPCVSDTSRYVTGPLASLTMQWHDWLYGVDSHLTSDCAMHYLTLRCPEKSQQDQRQIVHAREHGKCIYYSEMSILHASILCFPNFIHSSHPEAHKINIKF